MNFKQRTIKTLGPWYRALFEDSAESRTVDEWAVFAKKTLLATAVMVAAVIVSSIAFGSDAGVTNWVLAGTWLAVFTSLAFALKTGVSEYRSPSP